MGFSKRNFRFRPSINTEEVFETVKSLVEEITDTGIVKNIVVKKVSHSEIEKSLPDSLVYTLENLLQAGVNLETLPCGNLLDKTDLADVDSYRELISSDLYFKLMDLDAQASLEEEKNKK